MQDNYDGISSDSVLVPPNQIMNRFLPLLRDQLLFFDNDSLVLILLLFPPINRCPLLHLIPVLQFRLMLCKEVLLGFWKFTLFFNFVCNFDNNSPKVFILWLLCLFDHSSQISEVLFIFLKIWYHRSLWWNFRFINSRDTSIKFVSLLSSYVFQRICL